MPGVSGAVDLDQGNPGPPLYDGSSSTVIDGPPNAPLGQPATFAAKVSPTPSGGTLTFADSGTAIIGCSALPLISGGATCHTSALPSGAQSVAAFYSTGSGYFSSAGAYSISIQATQWPKSAGAPSVAVSSGGGQEAAFWRGNNDDLWEAWYKDGPWDGPVDWTTTWGASIKLASAPSVAVTSFWQQLVYWQGTNSDLWEAWYTPGFGWTGPIDWTATWGLRPVGVGANRPRDVVRAAARLLAGDQRPPVGGVVHSRHGLDRARRLDDTVGRVGGRGVGAERRCDGNRAAVGLLEGDKQRSHRCVVHPGAGLDRTRGLDGTLGGAGQLSSAPTGSATSWGQTLVFWQGANNDLWEAWYTPGSGWSWPADYTARWGGSHQLASAPTVVVTSSAQQLVYWQGTNDDLWEAWFTPGPAGPGRWIGPRNGAVRRQSAPAPPSRSTDWAINSCSGKGPTTMSARLCTKAARGADRMTGLPADLVVRGDSASFAMHSIHAA